jgi:hypothetical protein
VPTVAVSAVPTDHIVLHVFFMRGSLEMGRIDTSMILAKMHHNLAFWYRTDEH